MEEVKTIQAATCFDCQQKFGVGNVHTHEDQVLCEGCWNENIGRCSSCNESVRTNDLKQFNEHWYCTECADEILTICSSCNKQVEKHSATYSEIFDADYCSDCADDHLAYCAGCEDEVNSDNTHRDGSGDPYCDSCWEHRNPSDDEDFVQHHELSGISFQRCLSQRKFGVEIESCLESNDCEHLPMNLVGKWSSQHDGSLGEGGREYASPILQGDEGFKAIEEFTDNLKNWGYAITKSCGLHVHIDGRDLEYGDIRKLLKIVLSYEPVSLSLGNH